MNKAEYYLMHAEEIKKRQREYDREHKNEINEYKCEYRADHRDAMLERERKYETTHKVERNAWMRDYHRQPIPKAKEKIRKQHNQYKPYRWLKEGLKKLGFVPELHHEWIPKSAEYSGVALVDAGNHRCGVIEPLVILEGEVAISEGCRCNFVGGLWKSRRAAESWLYYDDRW